MCVYELYFSCCYPVQNSQCVFGILKTTGEHSCTELTLHEILLRVEVCSVATFTDLL